MKTYILGFTNEYFTLWMQSEPQKEWTGSFVEMVQRVDYIQNLSKNYDLALAKIRSLSDRDGIEYEEDLSLRGEHSFYRSMPQSMQEKMFGELKIERVISIGKLKGQNIEDVSKVDYPELMKYYEVTQNEVAKMKLEANGYDIRLLTPEERKAELEAEKEREARELPIFTFGKYRGMPIGGIKDIDYIAWYFKASDNVHAKEVLLAEGYGIDANGELLTPTQVAMNELNCGHHYENKKRVTLEVEEVDCFSFDGFYGTTYIITYKTADGKLVKYMGATPPKTKKGEMVSIMATIKHDNYNGQDETKLQRIKVLEAAK